MHFSPFEQTMHYEKTRSLRVFFQIAYLNNINEKVILKRIGGNFELIEILFQLLIKKNRFLKIIYLYSNVPVQLLEETLRGLYEDGENKFIATRWGQCLFEVFIELYNFYNFTPQSSFLD
jgi:hypothetical protein